MVSFESNGLFLILMITTQHFGESNSMLSIDDDADVILNKLLIDFLNDFEKQTFRNFDYRHAVVLGRDDIFLESTRSLLENKPHYIGNRIEMTIYASYPKETSLTLVHMDDSSDSELISILARLEGDISRKILLVTTEQILSVKTFSTTIKKVVKMDVRNAVVASLDRDSQVIKIYRRSIGGNCRRKYGLFNTWIWGKGFLKRREIFLDANKRPDLRGCPMTVSTIDLPPTMNLRKNENGSIEMISGIETYLIKVISQRLNFLPVVKMPTMDEQWWLAPNGTGYGIINDVGKGYAHIGIGKIRPSVERKQRVDMTVPYNTECLVWTVPLILQYEHSIILSEFSPLTWAMIITAFVLLCGLVFLRQKITTGKYRGSSGILELMSVSLGNPIPREPFGFYGKFIFLIYLNYSRVITIAYSSSLASILSTKFPEQKIRDEQGIFDAGLQLAGSQSSLDFLDEKFFLDHDKVNQYEVITSISKAVARIENHRDLAFIRHRSSINYIISKLLRAGKIVRFYPFDECVISYYSIIAIEKGSPLGGMLSRILTRLFESGIIEHWKNIDQGVGNAINKYRPNFGGLFVLKLIFFFYLTFILISLLSFIGELLIFKLCKSSCS